MEIVIAAQGIPFGPNTIQHRSLGGSETAALMMARELRLKGHLVTVFCNLPPPGQPDHIHSGQQDDIGTRWVQFEQYPGFAANTEVDLLICSRNPDLFQVPHQAKKAVLWCHDLATFKQFLPRLMTVAWNIDEIWCVSEYHKQQIHGVTGFPLSHIRATRNGIVKFEGIIPVPRQEKTLLYSARPERGLENLVKPGGIMEKLPDYTLRVTMYENFPEHMMPYYRQLWADCKRLPNVELLGTKTQIELRQLMAGSWLYVYPTEFEEVSCIIARECIEQKLPMLVTKVGALEETLGSCGYYMNGKVSDEGFADSFAEAVKYLDACPAVMEGLQDFMGKREDLYWPEVAEQWLEWAQPLVPKTYSLVHSLIQDGDVVAAKAVLDAVLPEDLTPGIRHLKDSVYINYPFLYGTSMEQHYEGIYKLEESKKVPERQEMRTLKASNRYMEIAAIIKDLPDDTRILEYGCAEGPIILQLALDFPNKYFVGVDFVDGNIELCKKFAEHHKITNAEFHVGSTEKFPLHNELYDAAIVAEVLEHTIEPWDITAKVEAHVKLGGKMILTVPQGAWEWNGLKNLTQWHWRAHIWHINKWMLRKMFRDKEECILSNLSQGTDNTCRAMGHLVMTYQVDHKLPEPIDPLMKARQHRCRQTVGAAIIAMNDEDTILRCLNSIERDVCQIQIALGSSTDHTRQYVEQWAKEHPWIQLTIKDVPAIKAEEFGFDDARNASMEGLDTDWVLWIDTDEYLSGEHMLMFTRNNCFDSYAIHQHHFSCEPRGVLPQMDKPARLMRMNGRFKFFGKVHEHAELGFNGGPGFVMVLPNVDIGHTGYVNENSRRQRFSRNFPLLVWDQKVFPERKLGRFLWLRDMIHRMRIIHAMGDEVQARRLAEEAIDFFTKYSKDFDGVGCGNAAGNSSMAFYSEAMKYLGRGHAIEVGVKIDDQTAGYAGQFKSADEAFSLANRALSEEIRKRETGYWG